MRLNKAICKRCWRESFEQHGWDWDEWTDDVWSNDGVVSCPYDDHSEKHAMLSTDVERPEPPSYCPYAAEHVVN